MDNFFTSISHDLNRCSYCGLCKEKCPIFLNTKNESYSARGILVLLSQLASGGSILSHDEVQKVLFSCVDCKFCMEKCPALVPIERIFFLANYRYLDNSNIKELNKKLHFIRDIIPNMDKFRNRLRIYKILDFLHLDIFIPDFIIKNFLYAKSYNFVFDKNNEYLRPDHTTVGKKVGILTDWLGAYVYPSILNNLLALLIKLGYEVFIPASQMVGLELAYEYNQIDIMNKIISYNISLMKNEGVDYIVTISPELKYIYNKFVNQLIDIKGWLSEEFINDMLNVFDIMDFLASIHKDDIGLNHFPHSVFWEYSKRNNNDEFVKKYLNSIQLMELDTDKDLEYCDDSFYSLDNGRTIEITEIQNKLFLKKLKKILNNKRYEYILTDSLKTKFFLDFIVKQEHTFPYFPSVLHISSFIDNLVYKKVKSEKDNNKNQK